MTRGAWLALLALLLHATPVSAQEQGADGHAPADSVALDFQDAELRLVLSALAEMAGLNLLYADLPDRRVTLRTSTPVPRTDLRGFVASLAEANDLEMSETGGLLRIDARPPGGTPRSPPGPAQETSREEPHIFVYRLQHAQAAQLSQTLSAIFGGGAGPGGGGAGAGLSRQGLAAELQGQRGAFLAPGPESVPSVDLGSAHARELSARLSGPVKIVPDAPTNALLIHATPADYAVLQAAVQELDTRPLQVLIEVLIAEVRHDASRALGVGGTVSHESGSGSVSGTLAGISNGDLVLRVLREGAFSIDAFLSALSKTAEVSVLSRPVVIAQNNEEARILVGSQRPFIQLSRALPTDDAVRDQVVQYRDVGTQLTIRPTVNPDGYVSLVVLQEVSTATSEIQFDAPVISNREASTRLFVKDGHTAVLGGLVENSKEWSRTGIPILKDIPLLGGLFGSTQAEDRATELFLFLTPHVLRDDDEMEAATRGIRDAATLLESALNDAGPLLPPRDLESSEGPAGEDKDGDRTSRDSPQPGPEQTPFQDDH